MLKREPDPPESSDKYATVLPSGDHAGDMPSAKRLAFPPRAGTLIARGPGKVVNAICVPSDDHEGSSALAGESVIWRRSSPAALTVQMLIGRASPSARISWKRPLRSELNASRSPSGDHAGVQ